MSFYYIYKALAHPEWDGYVTPYTLEERLMHVDEAKRTLGSRITWLVDTMDNVTKHTMGDAPNSEWILDENNKIVVRRDWSDPDALRADLANFVGPVDPPTRVEDLNMPTAEPPKVAASGVVPPVEKPGRMAPVAIDPIPDKGENPFYAKLRVEATPDVFKDGSGTLHLSFRMDPLYHVHWNNEVDPIRVLVEAPDGATVSKRILEGPKVDAPADIDPREFLVDVSGMTKESPLKVTVSYFACDDEAGWCRQFEQSYLVHMDRDRDGGSVIPSNFGRRIRGGFGGGRPGGGRPGGE